MNTMNVLFTLIVFIITWTKVEPEVWQHTSGNIVVGGGYSSDTQQVVAQVCYNATVSSTSAQQAFVQLDTALSFSDLENKLGISVSIGGRFLMFSAEATASYMRSMQDKDYSLSLNYYEHATNNVAVQLAGYGEGALTESGKGFYNSGKNPYFGLVCGDYYIKDYKQGALLIMGVNIKFSSSSSKKEFEEKVGGTFADIVSASESVKTVVTTYKIHGSVMLQAFQIGGDPSQLASILNKDKTGQYYALTCSLTAMDNCVKAASGLLDYAKNNFSKQFSFKNNTGLTPLGIAFSQYDPIKYIGLNAPASLVTDEVVHYRNELSSRLKENEYYQQKFYSFLDKGYYPVKLDDAFTDGVNSILSTTKNNVALLMQPHEGAADCFNFPDKCKDIKADIDSRLQNVTKISVKLLEDMKYTITTYNKGTLYNTGGGSAASWIVVPSTTTSASASVHIDSVNVTNTEYNYTGSFSNAHTPMRFVGQSNGDMEHYFGTLCTLRDSAGKWQNCRNYTETKQVSPFFFEAYSLKQ